MSEQEIKEPIRQGEAFSLVHSTRWNKTSLALGPIRFVNSDCRPNCTSTFVSRSRKIIRAYTLTDIQEG
jgi:hypothetical protein